MARIDENGSLSMNQISIAVIFVGILPEVGIEAFFNFHPVELLRTFSTSVHSFPLIFIKRWKMCLSNKKLKFRGS